VNEPGRHELRTLALALIASLLLWNLPFGGVVLYPFKILATWLHEMSHGLVMIATGAELDRVVIYRDTSGLSYAVWAISAPGTAAIAAAGYMGTSLWGAVLLVATPTAKAARWALLVVAVLLLATAIFAIVPTPEEGRFGQWATLAIAAGIVVCAIVLPPRIRVFGAHFLAAQACINALLDIRVLLRPMQAVNGVPSESSDASQMARNTFGINAMWAIHFWAIVWLVWSVVVLFVALRLSGSRAARNAARAAVPTA
jgi:hypothetical protein